MALPGPVVGSASSAACLDRRGTTTAGVEMADGAAGSVSAWTGDGDVVAYLLGAPA